ncbi:sn-glycerol-3-phosphate ABC transporter ATP-binding protein UgpC [Gemmobacter nectariphilus]|uniref:sn-glycerol-3-phosphate ABC transporter ATP-binding protein UgpC n=1 Tax=Gemmobacter nectariphilus TaxID=220343 RepID=UPI0004067AED|nr:sn-glycerol-3-phosphate ABC transporter ATP-binding protein UgpC [Gemmobacter nectariphilus]
MADLNISGVKKLYDGKQVLHGIDIAIQDGAFVVIVGPSGCGKSTLLRMIAGLEDISEGDIAIGGQVVNDIDPAGRGCAMVFQNYALYPHMTVRENMAYPLKIARLPRTERDRRVAEAAAILDLTPYLDRRPAQLSGGQRQRVAMGRAIVREPQVFLFDEPLSNLDAKLRVTMRIEIRRLHRRLNATSIFVTHDQVEAMTLADMLVVMNGGHVEQMGTPVEIYRRPASTFVAGFLGAPAMNLMPARVQGGRVVLEGAGGHALTVPGLAIPEGTAFTLGVRPEEIEVARSAPLMAQVDLVEELGGSRIAWVAAAGQELAVMLPRDLADTPVSRLGLVLPAGALHAFDLASGKRIALTLAEAAASQRAAVAVA